MSAAIDLVSARLDPEEGTKILPYDDATGKPVKAPVGNLSWGKGFNLMACGSEGLFEVMERYLLSQIELQLLGYAWYSGADPVRQSVFLDIAYNAGLHGLLHYPHMISFAAEKDWTDAAAECKTSNPELAGRYERLAKILETGVA